MRRTLVTMCALSLLLAPAPPASGQAPAPSVDAAVQVTSSPNAARGHAVPAVAVDPRNEHVLVVAEADTYSGSCAVHVSTNAGLSWTRAASPDVPAEWPNCTFVNFGPIVDVAFAPDGTLYYAFSGFNPAEHQSRVFLARSDDLGATWETTTLPWIAPDLDNGEAGVDAVPSIAIDPNDPERVYVGWGSNWATYALTPTVLEGKQYYWDVIERVYVAASTDGGETFSEPVDVGDGLRLTEEVEGVKPPPQVLVGNDGEVYAFFGEYARAGNRDSREGTAPPASIYMAVSRDGGQTYENGAIHTGPEPTGSSDWTWVPRAGIDRRNGDLHVVWEDLSSADDPVRIAVITSTDGGDTWSEPTQVNDVVPSRKWNYPEAYPHLSVASDGRVDVAWYDPRNDPTFAPENEDDDNAFHDVYYSYSTDGGATWTPNVRVTDRMIDRRLGPSGTGGVRGTLGLVALDTGAYVAWDDTRNANPATQAQDIYFTRIRLETPSEFFAAASAAASPSWGLLATGAGLALAAGGIVLLLVTRALRRRDTPAAAVRRATARDG